MSDQLARSPFDLSAVRNRIIGHIELLPSEILDHPGQAWDHPLHQAEALTGILREIGIVDEILVYRSPRANNAYVTPDGHLRKSLDPRKPWPCTVLDLTDEEADYVLATKDPVGALKQTNAAALDALLSSVSSSEAAVQAMFADIAAKSGLYLDAPSAIELHHDADHETAFADNAYTDNVGLEFVLTLPAHRADETEIKTALAAFAADHALTYKTRVLRKES